MTRHCGGCTLCCKLIPVEELKKPAGERCKHQRHAGCAIYARRPLSCRFWNCRWLVNDDTADLRRPDRARYVIDIMPDFVTITHDGEPNMDVEVVQIWVDPHEREAWRDPPLLAYMERRASEGIATILRFSSYEALIVFPPAMSEDGQWHEHADGHVRPERSSRERHEGIARARAFMNEKPAGSGG
jgi:hypothetical protein